LFYDFLRNLQETAKALLLFELPFRGEALGKISFLAMWSLGAGVVPGRRPAAIRPNSGQPPAGAGRARAGEGPWVLGDRFRGSDGAGRRPARGALVARHGGCRGWNSGGVGSMQGAWGGWGVRVGAEKGGGMVHLACSRPELAARRGGLRWRHGWRAGGGGRSAAWRDA
jgi:hypothetical protein